MWCRNMQEPYLLVFGLARRMQRPISRAVLILETDDDVDDSDELTVAGQGDDFNLLPFLLDLRTSTRFGRCES